jgi:hypothetical protein
MATNFRTIGWFGSECYTPATRFVPPQGFIPSQLPYMNIRKFWNPLLEPKPANQPSGYQGDFPLELAMKIFWEAETITMTSNITTSTTFGPISASGTSTIKWGSYNDESFPPTTNLRDGVLTAKEMLCHIDSENKLEPKPPFGSPQSHTAFRKTIVAGTVPTTQGPKPYTTTQRMVIGPRPLIYKPENINLPIEIYAPFTFGFEFGGLVSNPDGIFLSSAGPIFQGFFLTKEFVMADIITPWGNTQVRTTAGNLISDGSMTITVTAADPKERYA